MTLSNSRQQFLAYESQSPENIHYGRKGGMFVSSCVCVSFILFAVIVAVLVGVIVHFITYFKLSQKTTEFWDETEPFGQTNAPSADLRLPSYIAPSLYKLQLKADLESSTFNGTVFITIRTTEETKEVVLHAKNLSINSNAKLAKDTYNNDEILSHKSKREVTADGNSTVTTVSDNVTTSTSPPILSENTTDATNVTTSISSESTTELSTEYIPSTTIEPEIIHKEIEIVSITEHAGDRVILTLATAMQPDVDYTLELSFQGTISNSLTGFYKSTYTNNQQEVKQLGVTQFEPTSARAAFPCFDEPGFKAQFEISIQHPKNITVLSNMKVQSQEFSDKEPDWQWTHFQKSVKMSTYLVAYILSDFKSLETSYVSKDKVVKPIRVWTRPELISKANYALNITPKLLDYYEDVFGVPYALDKLDLIAIPDFSSGAMENWGLITFRETTLLFDETESVPRDKQNVAIDIAHELAHQWFGNLVTMKWWTDLWLNEGFATYIEYVGVDHIEPEWNMFESFSRDKMDLLRSDALKNTSPVSRRVIDASEISQKFDEISYTKGANLIRMLNHTMSEELFHKGLVVYLNDWQYSNAEENDLWQAMSKAVESDPILGNVSVVEFMNSWTRQAGYPVVNVTRNYETGEVEFEQNLFSSSKKPYASMMEQLWYIPISYTILDSHSINWSTKPKTWLQEKTKTINLQINDTQALYVNIDAIGYYRVNYDQKNWELLSKALKSGHVKSPITKAQLIDDAFNFAKTSELNYSYALGLTTCVMNGEDSKIVWDLLLNNMAFLRHNLKASSGYVYFQDYMKKILSKQLERLNYGLDKPKDDNEAFLIENLVMWECYVESTRCLDWAKDEFEKWASQPDLSNNPIPSYLRSLVYNMALRHGGRREFDLLWNIFLNSTDPNVKTLIITNLPSIREESLITTLLEKSLTEIPKQYAVAVWSVEAPIGTRIAQDFLINHFDRVYDKFTEMDAFMFPNVLSGAFGFITSKEELNKLKTFALRHKEKLLPMSQTLQKLVDTATLRINWINKHADNINKWFKDFIEGNSTMTTEATATISPVPAVNSSTLPVADGKAPTPVPTELPTANTTEKQTSP